MLGRLDSSTRMGVWPGTRDLVVHRALAASGTTQADALAITGDVNVIGTAAASSGVRLPAPSGVGDVVMVTNRGANTTALSVAVNARVMFVAISGPAWLAQVSA